MRVEIVYNPQCNLYKSAHKVLEDVIAEERLPLPVEMIEDKVHQNASFIRLDGRLVMKISNDHTFDQFREFLHKTWTEITHPKKTANALKVNRF